jgi:peptide deformylase
MSDLEILTVDNEQQLQVLRSKSRKVQRVTPKMVAFAEKMLETMREANGVGLAAPQVGVLQRFFVVELPEDEENDQPAETYVLFNPEIVKGRGEQVGYEGCLSIPGYIGEVARQERITVKGLNEKGKSVRLKLQGYLARVFQHEIDHLDGILFTDRLTDPNTFQPVEVGQEEAAELQAAAEQRAFTEQQATAGRSAVADQQAAANQQPATGTKPALS